ncbi:hypothetical protein [Paenibacillus arenosi]|uniref:ABC transporter permease n=1 Tax=Paenibacillus arenosi TaxID=2774142 RepID=A0ABR9ATU9_9BACL|nr:hypothetical protein [Paenibacillus arenosi]MBD8497552.1 hypothetical protein [Paenibacillus arenosi]
MSNKSNWMYELKQLLSWWSLLLISEIGLITVLLLLRDIEHNPPMTFYMHEVGAVPFAIAVFIVMTYKESTLPMLEIRAVWPVSIGRIYLRKIVLVLAGVLCYQTIWYSIYVIKYDAVFIRYYQGLESGFVYGPASWWAVVWTAWSTIIFYLSLLLFFMAWTRQAYIGWLAAFFWWMMEVLSTGSILGEWSTFIYTWNLDVHGVANRIVYLVSAILLFAVAIWLFERRERWCNSVGEDQG